MARDYNKQKRFQHNGYAVDTGYIPFATTALTVELFTTLSRIYSYQIQPATASTEFYYINETVSATGEIDASALTSLTLTRSGEVFNISDTFGIDDFTSNDDLIERVLFTAPYDMTIASAKWSNSIGVFTGSPVLNVGTTSTDPVEFIDAQAITVTTLVTTTFSTFASTAISSGDIVRANTTGGTGSGPYGSSLTLSANRAPVSAQGVYYTLIGVD